MKVVVFDLDDTLFKEEDFVRSGYSYICDRLGRPDALEGMWNAYRNRQDAFESLNRYCGTETDKSVFLEWYRGHFPKITLSEGALELLEWLVSQQCKIGIITDGRKTTQSNKIDALGLNAFIDANDVVISEVFGSAKPDARNYQYFVEKYGEDAEYWYVGDNTDKDFIAPLKLGWQCICLKDDGRNVHKQGVLDNRVNVISNILDVQEFLKANN